MRICKQISNIESGRLSAETNKRGHKVGETAELDRVYGLVAMLEPNGNSTGSHRNALETAGSTDNNADDVVFLTREVEHLKAELEASGKREAELKEEKAELKAETSKILDMLAIEQEKTKLLMLPNPEPESARPKKASWLGYFRRKR